MTELTIYKTIVPTEVTKWVATLSVEEFPENGGLNVKIADLQIAIFNFTRRNEWYATQNLCPHKQQMILARGMIGSSDDEPKVACPFHKKTFSLKTGENINGDECPIATYPVKIQAGIVYVGIA